MAFLQSLPRRQALILLLFTAAFSLVLITVSHTHEKLPDVPFLPKWQKQLPVIKAGRTVIYESAVHDEVIGALGHSLSTVNVSSTYATSVRFKFNEVLEDILPEEPDILPNRNEHDNKVREWLRNDEIDNLILTTCLDGVTRFHDDILASTANVVCVVHHGGGRFGQSLKDKLKQLVQRNQITLLVLGHHVWESINTELQSWADDENAEWWEKAKLETFIPGFVYPRDREFRHQTPFPHKAVIQGNIEPGRRNYKKIFAQLNESMFADPALWGYKWDNGAGVFVADSPEPFELHLLGQINPNSPVEFPPALKNVITVDAKLPYPDYYKLIADADLLIPAFAHRGTLSDTASSTMAAAIITRTPVLVSERHTRSYTYIKGPAAIYRKVSEGAIHALERLRRTGDPRPPPDELRVQWDEYEANIQKQNADMWSRVLTRQGERKLWGLWR